MLMDGQSNLLRLNVLMAELVCFSARENISLEELHFNRSIRRIILKQSSTLMNILKNLLMLQDVADQLLFQLILYFQTFEKIYGEFRLVNIYLMFVCVLCPGNVVGGKRAD